MAEEIKIISSSGKEINTFTKNEIDVKESPADVVIDYENKWKHYFMCVKITPVKKTQQLKTFVKN